MSKSTVKRKGQFGRKNSVIVSFILDIETLAAIDAIVAKSAVNCKLPMSRSQWIKRAISRDLHHKERGRRCKRKKRTARAPAEQQLQAS